MGMTSEAYQRSCADVQQIHSRNWHHTWMDESGESDEVDGRPHGCSLAIDGILPALTKPTLAGLSPSCLWRPPRHQPSLKRQKDNPAV